MKKLILALLLTTFAALAWATSLVCSIDKGNLMWTGKTRVEMGVMLYEHKCVSNHYYWLTSEQMNN